MTSTVTASGATAASAASRKPSSTTKPESLAAALAELQQHLPRIGKDAQAQYGKYADLADVSRVLLPVLGQHGFSFVCTPTMMNGEFILEYTLFWAGGESPIEGFYPLPDPAKYNPQQLGSAITYARRYCLLAVTGAAPDDDDDDARSAEHAARAQRNKPPETRADGSATEAELSRMTRGHEPGTERFTGPPPDEGVWQDQPPGNVAPEEVPSSSLPSQRQDIYIAMSKRDILTPEARREAYERLTGRQVEAAKQLSFNEAEMVKAALRNWDSRTEKLLANLVAEKSAADA